MHIFISVLLQRAHSSSWPLYQSSHSVINADQSVIKKKLQKAWQKQGQLINISGRNEKTQTELNKSFSCIDFQQPHISGFFFTFYLLQEGCFSSSN